MEEFYLEQDFAVPKSADDPGPEWLFIEAVSPSMRAVEAVIRELAHSSVPVLLLGEPGAGKRTIARRIHQNAGGTKGQFHIKNCRTLAPHELTLDSSSSCTLYFDEVGELSLECQGRVMELVSAGNDVSRPGEARVICSSSHDLEADVRAGAFREDLYYRLSGVCLRIPPLRQRKEDVAHLMSFFMRWYSEAFHRPVPALSASTQKLLLEYSWPGNLSELAAAARAIVAVGDESVAMGGLRSMLTRFGNGANGEKTSLKEAARAASREAERELILKVLTKTRCNRRRAAQELQISYKALLYKLKQIGYRDYGA